MLHLELGPKSLAGGLRAISRIQDEAKPEGFSKDVTRRLSASQKCWGCQERVFNYVNLTNTLQPYTIVNQ